MKPVTRIDGRAIPLGLDNIDTDIIIPAAHLKTIRRDGLGRHAFEAIRAKPGNVIDDPAFAGAPIMIAGANFGCGSSREHAAWALTDLGVEAVIAEGFSDIFGGNAYKNGIVAVVLPRPAIEALLMVARRGQAISVDLAAMRVTSGNDLDFAFTLDPFRRDCLLGGLDEIGLTLKSEPAIAAFEQQRREMLTPLLATADFS